MSRKFPQYKFEKREGILILRYEPMNGSEWIDESFRDDSSITIKRTFEFKKTDLINQSQPSEPFSMIDFNKIYYFKVGRLLGEYYKIDCFRYIHNEVYIHKDIDISMGMFVISGSVSIFEVIDRIISHNIYVGGNHENSIPEKDFIHLCENSPKQYEIDLYKKARVCSLIKEYVNFKTNYHSKFEKYLNKKLSQGNSTSIISEVKEIEIEKYQRLYDKLMQMLGDSSISEHQWQEVIVQFIIILFPKYIKAVREVPIKDSLNDKMLKVDIGLIDTSGYLDIIEIKKPTLESMVTSGKYRNNHAPIRELSGTIMQIEKYLYHLNRWGDIGEKKLNEKYAASLPSGMKISVINSSGIIIMGRDNNLSPSQKLDFEVIKRKYKNVMDIITYDDLLRRLKVTIESLKSY